MAPRAANRASAMAWLTSTLPGDDRRRIFGAEHGAARYLDLERAHAAGVQGDVVVNHAAECVQHGGPCHRFRSVEVVRLLFAGAGEVDDGGTAVLIDSDADRDLAALVETDLGSPVLQTADQAPDAFLGIIAHMAHIGIDDIEAEGFDH